MKDLTQWQQAVEAHIRAAGHATEWRPNPLGRLELYIDGLHAGGFAGRVPMADSVRAPDTNTAAWRARKLPHDPEKAAKVLLGRHAAMLRAEATSKALDKQCRARASRMAELTAALAGVATVDAVHGDGATLRFEVLTVEQAAKIAAALKGEP